MALTTVEKYFARASGLGQEHPDEGYTTDPATGPLIPHVANKSQIGARKFDKAAFGIVRQALRKGLSGLLGTVTVGHVDMLSLLCKTGIATDANEAEKIIPEILREKRVYLDDRADFYLSFKKEGETNRVAYKITYDTDWDL